jgi:hypothetical protein
MHALAFPQFVFGQSGCRKLGGAHRCFTNPLMLMLGGWFLKLAGTDVVSDS